MGGGTGGCSCLGSAAGEQAGTQEQVLAGTEPGASSSTCRDLHLPSGQPRGSGLSREPSQDGSLHPGKREPQPLAVGTAPAHSGSPQGGYSPQKLPFSASSITSTVPFFLQGAVWGHKRQGLSLLAAGAADAIAAGTALTSWLPAQGGL